MEKIKEDLMNQRREMIKELIQGIEVTNKLRDQFLINTDNNDVISTDNKVRDDLVKSSLSDGYISEICENQMELINNILSSFDKTISMAKLMMTQPQQTSCFVQESPPTQNPHHFSKKRKKNPKKIKRVRVEGSALGSEGTLGDGCSWRKYGQKIILGAKFPRGYYRCTYRHSQGCEATKQVQQVDEDPTMYEIIYSGEHTCSSSWAQVSNRGPIMEAKPEAAQMRAEAKQEVFLGLGPNGELKVEEYDEQKEAHLSNIFPGLDFGSANSKEMDYFSMSPTGVISVGGGLDLQFSDSELNDSMSAPNSVTNSPKDVGFDFPLDPLLHIDFDFSFDF